MVLLLCAVLIIRSMSSMAMVQGGKHGGSVAGPVAAHIMQQVLAMDQGSYHPDIVSLKAKLDNPHPFNEIDAMPDYTDNAPALVAAGDESSPGDQGPGASAFWGSHRGAAPDIKAGDRCARERARGGAEGVAA